MFTFKFNFKAVLAVHGLFPAIFTANVALCMASFAKINEFHMC